jgi:hypothetical protein
MVVHQVDGGGVTLTLEKELEDRRLAYKYCWRVCD